MKRLYTFGIAILALAALAGCNDIKELAESLERTVVLTATHEGLSPDTKTLRMDDGSTWWNPAEEISVFYGSGTNGGSKFTSKNTTIAEITEFEGSISMSGSKEFWAAYPYSIDNSCDGSSIITVIPSQQTGVEGNFSNDAFPAMGKSGSLSMPFYNICGGIKFYVSRADIKSVTFKGNNGEAFAGKVKVVFGVDGKPEVAEVLDGKTEVTLKAPDGGSFKAGKYYYMTLLPASLEEGFTMSFTTVSETGTFTSNKPQTVKRSIFGTLKNIDAMVIEWESIIPAPEYVDLGLSVKWATFNVGATKPEEYGEYFAWGETVPKSDYRWESYRWCDGTELGLTKYNLKSYFGIVDNKTELDPEDDVAYVTLGSKWRMPTDAELTELRARCTWERTTENGVEGYRVIGPNTNSIFLPAAGCQDNRAIHYNNGASGYYWSSSLDTNDPRGAYRLYYHNDYVGMSSASRYRYVGFSVRPVYGEFIHVESITLDNTSLELTIGESAQLNATVSPTYATAPSIRWVSGDESIVSVDQTGSVSALTEGSTTITAYSSNGLSASCFITVTPTNPVDLSSSGTANCYIVPAEGAYCFKANKGNSSTAIAGASAEILWRSFNTNEKPGANDIIVNPAYKDGFVFFSTAKEFREGNAVIAVKSQDGTILWSWHIWVSTADLEGLKQTYANNAGVMMDRNLGALSAQAGDPLSFGLLYEWGRKDPFTGCASYDSTTPIATDVEWPSAIMTRAINQQSMTALEYSIKHPMQYIYNSELPYDWQALSQDECDYYLWSSKKTIYDPCPIGWRVPDGGDDGLWKKAGIPEASLYNTALKGIWIVAPYCSPSAWYPSIGGGRQWNGGNINHVGEWGSYWSSTYMYESWMDTYPQTWNFYYDYDFYASETRSKSHSYSGQGQAVRCCKE